MFPFNSTSQIPLPPEKSQLDPLAKVVQELTGFTFQILFHLDPRVQSFEVITQIESFSSSNRQSTAYRYILAASYPNHSPIFLPQMVSSATHLTTALATSFASPTGIPFVLHTSARPFDIGVSMTQGAIRFIR